MHSKLLWGEFLLFQHFYPSHIRGKRYVESRAQELKKKYVIRIKHISFLFFPSHMGNAYLQGGKGMPIPYNMGSGSSREDMFSQELKRNICFYIP
jgi:hypothetical protein